MDAGTFKLSTDATERSNSGGNQQLEQQQKNWYFHFTRVLFVGWSECKRVTFIWASYIACFCLFNKFISHAFTHALAVVHILQPIERILSFICHRAVHCFHFMNFRFFSAFLTLSGVRTASSTAFRIVSCRRVFFELAHVQFIRQTSDGRWRYLRENMKSIKSHTLNYNQLHELNLQLSSAACPERVKCRVKFSTSQPSTFKINEL